MTAIEHAESHQVTIILTTSPTPSAPSTELVSACLTSIPSALATAPLIVSCDGFTVCTHPAHLAGGRLKKGQIPQRLADAYPTYLNNIKTLLWGDAYASSTDLVIDDPTPGGAVHSRLTTADNRDIEVIQHARHQGFAFSVKHALRSVRTPLVLVMQHDWIFDLTPPLAALTSILAMEPEVRYITFTSRFSHNYTHSRGNANARLKTVLDHAAALRPARPLRADLIACLHFFDRPHLAAVAMYRDLFARERIRRGDFLEDTVGARYAGGISGAKDGEEAVRVWTGIGAWMYAPEEGMVRVLRHLSGRTVLGEEEQRKKIEAYRRGEGRKGVDDTVHEGASSAPGP